MYAIIENNLVVNNVVANPDYASEQGWVLLPEGVSIGWSYINGNFIDERPVQEPIDVTPVQPTKEELLAQITLLTQQVQQLSEL